MIEADPDTCYARLCQIERVPEWVPGVADVEVVTTDDSGRPRTVRFVAMPHRASVSYALDYEYDDDARTLRWTSRGGDARKLDGFARVRPADGGRAHLEYGVDSALIEAVPGWAEVSLRDEKPEPLVRAFARWLARPQR